MTFPLKTIGILKSKGGGIPTDALRGYWPFTGNANDLSGFGNNGTVNGAALTTDRKGTSNAAYQYNGSSDYIDFGTSSNLQMTTSDWSFCVWAYVTGGTGNLRGIFGRTFASTGDRWAAYAVSTNYFRVQLASSSGTSVSISSLSTLTLNKWYFIAVNYDRDGNMTFYLANYTDGDASPVSQGASSISTLDGDDITSPVGLFSGVYLDSSQNPANYFPGKIDNARVYSRILTVSEIQAIYDE